MTTPSDRPDRDQKSQREDLPPWEDHVDDHQRIRGAIQEFAGGEIRTYHGIVNRWLLAVYAILAAWGLYYLLQYWGGLGPGLAR
jgi:hypothetical protein